MKSLKSQIALREQKKVYGRWMFVGRVFFGEVFGGGCYIEAVE